jgi:hypothetical protein
LLFRVLNEDGTAEVETLWAYDLGDDQYKLDNCPFYAYAVSLHDIVYAPFDADEGFPTFQRIVSKSGNRTVRVILDPPIEPGNRSDEILIGLASRGCELEKANSKYVVVNIPPEVELAEISNYLVECSATWEHADPTYDQIHGQDT